MTQFCIAVDLIWLSSLLSSWASTWSLNLIALQKKIFYSGSTIQNPRFTTPSMPKTFTAQNNFIKNLIQWNNRTALKFHLHPFNFFYKVGLFIVEKRETGAFHLYSKMNKNDLIAQKGFNNKKTVPISKNWVITFW